jgi:hypothetical protein
MIVAKDDEMEGCSSQISREVFDRISQPKDLIEIDGGHFGLLHYPGELFDKASDAQISFLQKHLNNHR